MCQSALPVRGQPSGVRAHLPPGPGSCSSQAISAGHLTTGELELGLQLAFSCASSGGKSRAFADGAIYPLNCGLSLVAWF